MKLYLKILFLAILLISFLSCKKSLESLNNSAEEQFLGSGNYNGEYWPTQDWRECKPEEVGMDSEKLKKAYKYAANPKINTEGIIIIKNGYIVGEAYFNSFGKNLRHESYSVAKSFASALIGIAIDKGLICSVDRKIYHYYPEWQKQGTDEAKKRITIKHLLTMTAGLQWNEEDYYYDTSQNDVFIMASKYNYIQYVLNKPVINEPGTHWYYSSGESMLLSGILESVTGITAYEFALDNLFEPIGVSGIQWDSDPAGHTITAWGIKATVREFAKFGYLYLNKGHWEDQQVVSESWVEESTSAISDNMNHYAYQWWLPSAFSNYEQYDIPDNTFMAVGIYIQRIYVVPEKDLVVVRLGNDAGSTDGEWNSLEFLKIILDSIKEE